MNSYHSMINMASDGVYYDRLQEELLAKRKALQAMFTHSSTSGLFMEQMIREFLKNRVRGDQIGHGQIRFPDGTASPQFDLIIYDERISSPLFQAGDLVAIDSDAVKVVVEIKSIFGIRSSWKKEKEKIGNAMKCVKQKSDVSTFYFCFESDKFTKEEHDSWRTEFAEIFLDDFFVLLPRKVESGGPRVKGLNRKFNKGELKRFVDSITAVL